MKIKILNETDREITVEAKDSKTITITIKEIPEGGKKQ